MINPGLPSMALSFTPQNAQVHGHLFIHVYTRFSKKNLIFSGYHLPHGFYSSHVSVSDHIAHSFSVSQISPKSYLKLTISLESKKVFLNVLSSLLLIEI